MNEPNPQLRLEDLPISPEQREAIEAGQRAIETRRKSDEAAAEMIAENNPPFVPQSWWRRLLKRIF
jgi:hypothetical protein